MECDHLYTWMASWVGQHGNTFRVDGGGHGDTFRFWGGDKKNWGLEGGGALGLRQRDGTLGAGLGEWGKKL